MTGDEFSAINQLLYAFKLTLIEFKGNAHIRPPILTDIPFIDFTHLPFRRQVGGHLTTYTAIRRQSLLIFAASYVPTSPHFQPLPFHAYWVRDNLWALCVTSDATFTGIFRPHPPPTNMGQSRILRGYDEQNPTLGSKWTSQFQRENVVFFSLQLGLSWTVIACWGVVWFYDPDSCFPSSFGCVQLYGAPNHSVLFGISAL